MKCPKLQDSPSEKLYLRDFYQPHFVGSIAVYECAAGYSFENGVWMNTIWKKYLQK